ncbi:Aldedh domain-containing protein [Mucor velutinosus]|uniref:Derlin n=1 Tax=Mucor velutinosus TaxID=708070 RepID=A0AAN7DEA3_9FUNG|nr:Aldedh domain-containing protein [Mucor velutinosus]
MPNPLETWFTEIPPITRIYVSAACCTSIAVQLGFIHPLQLWLNYESIAHDFQWWRLITNFFYFGPLSIDFGFHIFFLARYSRMMEEGFFRNKPADYVWLMVFSASVLLVISIIVPFASLPFMGSALSFTMVYIWARRNPYVRLNFLGLLVFTAPYLPWVLLIFSLCLGGQIPTGDILGVLVGHIYYFFEDVWPRDPVSQGKKWLATPRIIRWLVEGNRPRDDSIEIGTEQVEEEAEEAEEAQEGQHAVVPGSTADTVSSEEPTLMTGDSLDEGDDIRGDPKEVLPRSTSELSTKPTTTPSPSTTTTSTTPTALSPKQSAVSGSSLNDVPSI